MLISNGKAHLSGIQSLQTYDYATEYRDCEGTTVRIPHGILFHLYEFTMFELARRGVNIEKHSLSVREEGI